MKRVFVSDGKIYVKDDAKKTSNEKALHDKIQRLESKVDELLKESSPEEKEKQELMKRLSAIFPRRDTVTRTSKEPWKKSFPKALRKRDYD